MHMWQYIKSEAASEGGATAAAAISSVCWVCKNCERLRVKSSVDFFSFSHTRSFGAVSAVTGMYSDGQLAGNVAFFFASAMRDGGLAILWIGVVVAMFSLGPTPAKHAGCMGVIMCTFLCAIIGAAVVVQINKYVKSRFRPGLWVQAGLFVFELVVEIVLTCAMAIVWMGYDPVHYMVVCFVNK